MANVALLGLGVMGFPMAGHLLTRGGHDVTVYNRTPARAQEWLAKFPKGKSAPTPAAAAKDAEFVFACVGNDADVRAVTTGADGAFAAMAKGSIFIDNTTTSAELARELSQAASAKTSTSSMLPYRAVRPVRRMAFSPSWQGATRTPSRAQSR